MRSGVLPGGSVARALETSKPRNKPTVKAGPTCIATLVR